MFSLESPLYPKSAAMGFFWQGTQERVRNSRGKRVISIGAIEVLLLLLLLLIIMSLLNEEHTFGKTSLP